MGGRGGGGWFFWKGGGGVEVLASERMIRSRAFVWRRDVLMRSFRGFTDVVSFPQMMDRSLVCNFLFEISPGPACAVLGGIYQSLTVL